MLKTRRVIYSLLKLRGFQNAKTARDKVKPLFDFYVSMVKSRPLQIWSGWSGFGRTTISQGNNKISLRKQVINRSTRMIFGLVQLVIIIMIQQVEKDLMR